MMIVKIEKYIKISAALMGKTRTEESKARQSASLTGRVLPKETRAKMSTSHMGEKNGSWQGGISFKPYSIEFNNHLKRQIRERNNHTCQECHQTEEQLDHILDVHHIDYDKKNNSPSNLISLCRSCHSQTNFSREDWTEYFSKIMEN